jgi:hypothetical protein
MPMPNIIVALYPDVPAFRGVPQLVRSPTAEQIRALAIANAAVRGRLWQSAATQPKWGIFKNGVEPDTARRRRLVEFPPIAGRRREEESNAAIVPDNIMALDNRNEARVSDFPVQAGAFAAYNKVAVPFELTVRLTKGGSVDDRARFLAQIEAAHKSLDLYYVLTPERTYLDVNITRYEVTRRGSGGAYYLTEVDVFFREIRQVAAQYSASTAATRNAQEPNARPSVSQGIVQPAPVPDSLSEDGF